MEAIQSSAAVVAVLVLLGASLWWLRRRGWAAVASHRAGPRRLETVERLPLGPQHALHLIRLGDKALVVACWPSGCVLLETVAWQDIETAKEVLR